MKKNIKLYETFHKKSSETYKIISGTNFTYINIFNVFKSSILKNKANKRKVLDIGCGVGAIDFFLANKGFNVTGIDISHQAIKSAQATAKNVGLSNKTKFFQGDLGKMSFNEEKFNVIICSEVLEHLQEDFAMLVKIKQLLSTNGILIVTVPSVNAPLYRWGLARTFDKRVGHLRRYSVEQISRLVENVGFKITKLKKTEGLLRNSLFLFPLLGFFIKFIKGPLVNLVSWIDRITIPILGESQIILIAEK